MNTWKVILATLVIFVAGVVTGGLLVRFAEQNGPRRAERSPGTVRPGQPGPAGIVRMDFLRRAHRELDLTPEQRQRIDKILKDHQEQIKKIYEPIELDIQDELIAAREEFLDVLTPVQRARFDELLKQQQQQRAREQHRSAPPRALPSPAPAPDSTNAPATHS